MGLTISDAIRLLMLRVANERRLPFDTKVPNNETQQAIDELEAGNTASFDTIDTLIATSVDGAG